jgi:hypothetical protein
MQEASACADAQLINVLTLLASFIGEELVLRLLQRGWPALEATAQSPGTGTKIGNEEGMT